MKITKKIVTILLMLAMVITTLTPFQAKVSKAANYLSAPSLPLNGTWSSDHYLTKTDNDHWYKIVIPSDGKLDLRISSYCTCYWQLYNSDLTDYFISGSIYGEETTPETDKRERVLSAGTYYINVYSGGTGKYNVYGYFTSYGANDQAAISYVSPLNYQLGSTVTGVLTETDREDWYKIKISSAGYYSQKIVAFCSIYSKLYNSDLTEEIISWNPIYGEETTPETSKRDIVLSPGTYYVQINSGTGKYTFQFNTLTQQNCTHAYERKTHDATYFNKGYTSYHCTKCGHSYTDNYEPIKKLGQGSLNYYSRLGKRKVKIYWYTVSNASGYQIRYSKKKNMKFAVVKTVKGQSKSGKTISKLSRRKKYYIQVRAYKKSGDRTVYGKWSAKKSFKTK